MFVFNVFIRFLCVCCVDRRMPIRIKTLIVNSRKSEFSVLHGVIFTVFHRVGSINHHLFNFKHSTFTPIKYQQQQQKIPFFSAIYSVYFFVCLVIRYFIFEVDGMTSKTLANRMRTLNSLKIYTRPNDWRILMRMNWYVCFYSARFAWWFFSRSVSFTRSLHFGKP